MSDALSLGLFDPEHGLNVSARAGATLLFEGGRADIRDQGPEIEPTRKGWQARLGQDFDVKLEPVAEPAVLGPDVTVHVCQVSGRIGGQKARCLGTVAQTHSAPAWDELDALRSVAAVFDTDNAFLAVARRPRGAVGHDAEEVSAWLLSEGEVLDLDQARLSTVYDGNGRQRSAGLELWVSGQDFPMRGSGTVVAGTSLALEGLEVHAAAFRWRMEDREGAGAYELWLRSEPEPA
ncbi:MAG TPA: hypothetical protein VFY44_13150 [Thermoleophilaceae bacterium]|nr:hypothetical protein [Thermoleophilaceae bacterium]